MREINTPSEKWRHFFYRAVALFQRENRLTRLFTHAPALSEYAPSLLISLLFVTSVALFQNFAQIFEYDTDEGFTLMSALMMEKGAELYTQLWNDQPPLFTLLLAGLFKIFGPSATVARSATLCFAGMIVFVVHDSLRCPQNEKTGANASFLSAAAGTTLLIGSSCFIQLSESAMIGLPAIAMMALACWSITEYSRKSHAGWAIAAGVLVIFSLGIKLFTLCIVPIPVGAMALITVLKHRKNRHGHHLRHLLLFIGSLTVTSMAVFLPYAGSDFISMILGSHMAVRAQFHGGGDGVEKLHLFFIEDTPLFTLAILGGIRAFLTLNGRMCLWFIWALTAFLALWDHSPVWSHHRLLLTIPAAILAGYAVRELISVVRVKQMKPVFAAFIWWTIAATAGFLIYNNAQSPDSDTAKARRKTDDEMKIVHKISKYRETIQYMVTSRQMYAFSIRKPVPPNLAMTSRKRFRNEQLNAKDIVHDVNRYSPEMIVMSNRWKSHVRRKVRKEVEDDYRRIYRTGYGETEIWLKNTISR